jgi:hypothetical protein
MRFCLKAIVAAALGTLVTVWMPAFAGSSRSDAGFVMPYKPSAISPVRIHAFGTTCRPEGQPVADLMHREINEEDGSLGFYVLFRSGGQHRETFVCTDGYKSKRISILYVPGQIDTSKVPVSESRADIGKCDGMFVPAVHHVSGLIFAISDPEDRLHMTVRLRHGTQVIQAQEDLFDIMGLPTQPPGFRYDVYSPHRYRLLPKTTYEIEVAFQRSWAAGGICPTFFRVGEFTTRPA